MLIINRDQRYLMEPLLMVHHKRYDPRWIWPRFSTKKGAMTVIITIHTRMWKRKKMTYEDRKTRERRRRQKVSQLITFGRRLKKKCDERKADASVVMTMRKMKDGADRDRALCASSIAANVQFLTTRACLSLFNLPPSLGLPLALNWGQMSAVCGCVLCTHQKGHPNYKLGSPYPTPTWTNSTWEEIHHIPLLITPKEEDRQPRLTLLNIDRHCCHPKFHN